MRLSPVGGQLTLKKEPILEHFAGTYSNLRALSERAENWICGKALPLWTSAGFDAARDMFQERLDFDGKPLENVPRRLMVQARQISVCAAAHLSGRFPAGVDLALRAARAMIKNYFEADGKPGWVFSLSPDLEPLDCKRDLYGHAFVIFALAWVLRLEKDSGFAKVIAKTLAFLDDEFADTVHGGCWDCLPRADNLRRQNPHMHLFEAYLELFETTRDADALRRCQGLRDLAVSRFFDPATSSLCEYFNHQWIIHPAPGQGSVEPGHLFEWSWLLRRFERASGQDQGEVAKAMIRLAKARGLTEPNGRIIDEIGQDGALRSAASRCWPHAEALKALAEEALLGDRSHSPAIERIARRLLDVYCPDELEGGWIDHFDENDKAVSAFMPASSLYHIYFGLDALKKIASAT